MIRQALRSLARHPGFALVAVVTLALGIGATTAIFTVFDAVILQPLPFPHADRVMLVLERAPKFPTPISISVLNYPDLRDRASGFDRVGVVRTVTMNLTGADDPVRIVAKMVSADVFDTLGVAALKGRTVAADDDRDGAAAVAVLSYSLWQQRYGGAPDIVGRTISLDGAPVSVIGVMPPAFRVVSNADLYVPVWPWLARQPQDRTWHPGLTGVARLKAGVTREDAQRDLDRIGAQLEQAYPDANLGTQFVAVPMLTQMVQGVQTALAILVAAVGGVLLIACSNVAGLLLARGLARRREIAVRTSLGASRRDIVALVLTESGLLAVAGGVAGLALASALVPPLVALAGSTLPRADLVAVNGRVVAFTSALAVGCALLFGVLPALSASRVDVRDVLAEGGRGSSGGRRQQRTRRVLVVAEIALTMVLLVSAGLLMRSFMKLGAVDPGFRPDGLLVADLPMSPKTYADDGVRTQAVARLLADVRALPGVTDAAVTTLLPLTGTGGSIHFNIRTRPPASAKDWIMTSVRAVSPSYFATMGIAMRGGRGFSEADREGAPHVAVVNEAFVKAFMPNDAPIGQQVSLGTSYDGTLPWLEIVGVAGDVKQAADADGRAELYVPYAQYPDPFFSRMYHNISVAVRTAGAPGALGPSFRQTVRQIDPNQPIINLRTMTALMESSVAQPKFRTTLIGLFAGAALLLAGIGVYGLLAHGVVQRRNEFGVRLALGAAPAQVVRLVVGEGIALAVIGLGLGALGAAFAVRLLQAMLFDVTPWDVLAWGVSAAALAGVAALASWIPARRSARVAPAIALRE